MAKFAILIVAAVAFHAALAGSQDDWQRQQRHMQWMARKIQELSSNAGMLMDSTRGDNRQDRRALMTQCNEFAHQMQDVVYNLQRAIQDTQGEDMRSNEKRMLQERTMALTDMIYATQQAMNSAEPRKMQHHLKLQMEKTAEEAQKMSQYFQQTRQPRRYEESTHNAMKRAMWDMHAALCKLQAYARNQDKTMQEIMSQMQTMAGQMSMYTQNVRCDDEQATDDLADWVQQLSQMMNKMVDKLEREVDNQDGETKSMMQQVANEMSEMRAELEQAANAQENMRERCNWMKNQLNRMHEMAGQAQRLMMAARQSRDEEGQGAKAVIKNVMMDMMAAMKTMQAQLKMMTEQRD